MSVVFEEPVPIDLEALRPLCRVKESNSLGAFFGLGQLLRRLYQLIRLLLITIPSRFVALLSIHINITLSFTYILAGSLLLAFLAIGVVRYRLLTRYSKYKEDPLDKQTKKEETFIREDLAEKKRYGAGSYLDEFLIALKIFGYLEKSVFNELVKNMRTMKLNKNDVLNMDENLGFVIVVEGNVQLYTKISNLPSGNRQEALHDSFSLADGGGGDSLLEFYDSKYQLLNEVKTGNPLSSFINILSLFTEEDERVSATSTPRYQNTEFANQIRTHLRTRTFSDNIAPLNLNDTEPSNDPLATPKHSLLSPTPDKIAKSTQTSTIAIIPAEAFRKLRRRHPRPSSHIVQMILTKLYRVTILTANNYLGMTKEIFETEVKLNHDSKLGFPQYLSDGVIKRLEKQESDSVIDESSDDRGRTRHKSSRSGNLDRSLSPFLSSSRDSDNLSPNSSRDTTKRFLPKMKKQESRQFILTKSMEDSSNPGDLLSNVSLSREPSSTDPPSYKSGDFTGEVESQEFSLKIALIEGMFKFLGIDKENLIPVKLRSNSTALSEFNSPIPFTIYQNQEQGNGKTRTLSITDYFNHNGANEDEDECFNYNYDEILRDFASNVKFQRISKDKTMIKQNEKNNGLYYVVSGELDVVYKDPSSGNERLVYTVKPGGVAGYLGSLIGSRSMVTVKAKEDTFVGVLPKYRLEMLCERYFMIYLTIAKSLISSLNSNLVKLDSALEWIQLDAGETLFKQDTFANGIYIVLSGRLRSFHENPATKETKIVDEYGQGETFGEVEVLTAAKRSTTFVALRDSETARIPRQLFEILAIENPSIMVRVSRIVAERIKNERGDQIFDSLKIPANYNERPKGKTNYRTITILPTRAGLPVTDFAMKLTQAFKNVNKTVFALDQVSTLNHLGRYAFERISRLKQSGVFTDFEENNEIVVYVADTTVNSTWTTTCIQQGDCILLLADALGDPSIGEYERLLLKMRSTAQTELVFLHPEKYVEPGLVSKWLKKRIWIDNHHHIQFNIFKKFSQESHVVPRQQPKSLIPQIILNNQNLNTLAISLKNQVENFRSKYKKHFPGPTDTSSNFLPFKDDFMRLARILSGQAVGVVLGGGGARGFSHLGILKALEDNGIPIDLIGGTSIGSFVGGLYAREYDLVPIYGRSKKFAHRVGSIWRNLFDLTIPIASYTTGHEFNRGIWKVFGESRIEDFWLNYFCNSTNITNSCMEIHSSGYAWRFIRASMSLAGLLPPITDNGSMLLDGGYVDNLPVDEMKRRGASVIFAVDVGSVDDRTPMDYGDSLSGAWILLNRLNPFSKHPNIPNMGEIQLRLCYVASVNALERAKETPGIYYLRPPIENYATLDFGKFEEIFNVGSIYGDMVLKELLEKEELSQLAGRSSVKNHPFQRRNSV